MTAIDYAALPRCGKCGKTVERGEKRGILDARNEVTGYDIDYFCHGEKESYGVMAGHHERDMDGGKKPFLPVVFEVKVAAAPVATAGDVIREALTAKMRSTRDQIQDFIDTKIDEVIRPFVPVGGSISSWREHSVLRLEIRNMPAFNRVTLKLDLVFGLGTVIGSFEVPFYFDSTDVTWTPK